jgi:two-component system, sensor histidine kinase RpfC
MLSRIPKRRVLVADDDVEVRRGVVDLLFPLGLDILQAESGLEVLELVRLRPAGDPLHLLVLDMHMPGCSGLEVLAALRARGLSAALEGRPASSSPAPVPCIFFSGNVTEELQRKALAAGACAFLRKPVQPDLLRGEVLRALGTPS